jgi:RHS repeat-associated protein
MKRIMLLTLLALLLSGCRITTTIVGDGTVTSQSGHFNCTTGNAGDCTEEYLTAGAETFTAVPAPGWTFAKWTNCNYVSITSCGTSFGQNTDPTANWTITATFKLINPPVQAATYTYNALGQRMTKNVGTVTTIFQYDLEGNLIAELNSSGQALRQHININGEPIAQVSTNPADNTIAVHYVHTDHLGTPTLLTNQSGNVVADIEATPFGETYVDYAEVEYNRRFPGQYKDAEAGLHYNYFRDYDPASGKYIQSDPRGVILDFSDPQRQIAAEVGIPLPKIDGTFMLNLPYGYADQNPPRNTDPTGENLLGIGRLGWAGIGAAITGARVWYNSYQLEKCLKVCKEEHCDDPVESGTNAWTKCRMDCAGKWTRGFGNKKAPLPKRM